MIWSDVFAYDNGNLIWKVSVSRVKKGDIAGTVHSDGYRMCRYKGVRTPAHRIVWEIHNGKIPDGLTIDHINRDRDDNRIENLRLATVQQNAWNKTGKGVYVTPSGKHRAYFYLNDKGIKLGSYDTEAEALAVTAKARRKHYGEFYNAEHLD